MRNERTGLDPVTPDRTLMRESLMGSARALRLIVERHQPSLLHYALGFFGPKEEEAREVTRCALRAGFKQLPRLRHNSLLSSFLIGTLRAELKARGIAKAPDGVSPLWSGLAGLPRVQREVIFLFFQGLNLRQVAYARREAPSHTRSRFTNGLHHIAKRIAGERSPAATPALPAAMAPASPACLGRDELCLLLAGELAEKDARAAQEHVATCNACRSKHEEGKRMFGLLAGDIAPVAKVPPLLTQLPGPSLASTLCASVALVAIAVAVYLAARAAFVDRTSRVEELPTGEVRALEETAAVSGTFSIIAVDPASGVCGAAVASKYPAVGSVVPYVRAGVGAFCTQHWHNPPWGPRALDALAAGTSPQDVLADLLRDDDRRDKRQLAAIDMKGRTSQHNPVDADPSGVWWGSFAGRHFACQGNTLTGRDVVFAMARAYEETEGSLADRLMAALIAGDAAGGDHRGRLAAGIRIAKTGVPGHWLELAVDESGDAVKELARKYLALKHDARGSWQGGAAAGAGKP